MRQAVTFTDLYILASMALDPLDAPSTPSNGERSAYRRLHRRGLITKMPRAFRAGEWYRLSPKGRLIVTSFVDNIQIC